MSGPLILAIPSKGRLKEQVEGWLADAGLPLSATPGGRSTLPPASEWAGGAGSDQIAAVSIVVAPCPWGASPSSMHNLFLPDP